MVVENGPFHDDSIRGFKCIGVDQQHLYHLNKLKSFKIMKSKNAIEQQFFKLNVLRLKNYANVRLKKDAKNAKNGSCCSFPSYALVVFYLQHESQFRERERECLLECL